MKKSKNPNAIPITSSIYRWQPLCRHHFPSNQQIRKVGAYTFIAWSCTKKSSMSDGRSLLQRFNDTARSAPLKNWKHIDEITQSRMYSNFHCSSASASQHRSSRKKSLPPSCIPGMQPSSLSPYTPFSDLPFGHFVWPTTNRCALFSSPIPLQSPRPPLLGRRQQSSRRTGAAKQIYHRASFSQLKKSSQSQFLSF